MLEDLISPRQWQALVQRVRRIRQLSLQRIRTDFAYKGGGQKPSLTVAIGKRRKANALEEYRRRFASTADRENPASQLPFPGDQGSVRPQARPDRDRAKQPQNAKYPGRGGRRRRLKAQNSRGGDPGRYHRAIWAHLLLALLRGYHGAARVKFGRNELIAVTLACAVALGGAYVYRTATVRIGSSSTSDAGQASDGGLENGGGNYPNGKKDIYERLTSGGPETEAAPQVVPSPQTAGPDNRAGGPLPEGAPSGDAPASAQPVAAEPSQRPPFRVLSGWIPERSVHHIWPLRSLSRLRPRFSRNPLQRSPLPHRDLPLQHQRRRLRRQAAHLTPRLRRKRAESAQPADSGYFVQVKSDQDLKAAEAELAAIAEKYKAVFGEVPLITKSVDLKEKGVWFRVFGPARSSRGTRPRIFAGN